MKNISITVVTFCFSFFMLAGALSYAQGEKEKAGANTAKTAGKTAEKKDEKAPAKPAATASEAEKRLRERLVPKPGGNDTKVKPDTKDPKQPKPVPPTVKLTEDKPKAGKTGTGKTSANDASSKKPKGFGIILPTISNVPKVDQPDPRIVGSAPGGRKPKLHREGSFVIRRRGRLVKLGENEMSMFVFDTDSDTTAETPMFLLPCRLLQNMESLARQQGDSVVFQMSGQVFAYRGANYLLPTVMKLAVDKGNLDN